MTSVLPTKQRRDQLVDLWGRNLIVAGGPEAGPQLPHIFIADKEVTDVTVISNSRDGSDHLKARVPADAAVDDTHIQIVTAAGIAPNDPQPFEVLD